MAEEQETEPTPEKKKSKMPIVIAAIVVVNAAAIGGFFLLSGRSGGEKAEKKEAAKAEEPKKDEEGPKVGPLVVLDSFIVNVAQGDARYLKAELSVEIESVEKKKEFDELKPLVRNEILLALSAIDVERAKTANGKKEFEKRVAAAIRKRLGSELIRNVYFTEFVTQ
jgi:flagellar protein FliL